MMRNAIIATVLAGGVYGCVTPTAGITPGQVQSAVLAACAFSVPANEIAALLATGDAALSTASAIAAIICKTAAGTVTPAVKASRNTTVRVYGVTLHLRRI